MSRLLLCCCLPLFLYAQNTTEADLEPYEDSEAYSVYSAVLTLEQSKGELLIADTTVPFSQCAESDSDKELDAAIASYKKTNQTQRHLGYHFDLKRPYRVLSPKEEDELIKRDEKTGRWRLAPSKFIHRFSAVGFNSDKTLAFFQMDVICGELCGHGSPYTLQKKDGKWVAYSASAKENADGSRTLSGLRSCFWMY